MNFYDEVGGCAVWYSSALPVVPLRWVLVRDPQNTFKAQAFLCTDEAVEPEQILAWFVRRWQIDIYQPYNLLKTQ